MTRPTRDRLLMSTARVWATRGTCTRAQVGCVISRDGRILVQGYNGTPRGLPHCDHTCTCGRHARNRRNPDWDAEIHDKDCAYSKSCTLAVHAEANAIAHAAKVGVTLVGSEMHSSRVPCTNCAMLIINAGITRVVYMEDHWDMGGLALLRQASIDVAKDDRIVP